MRGCAYMHYTFTFPKPIIEMCALVSVVIMQKSFKFIMIFFVCAECLLISTSYRYKIKFENVPLHAVGGLSENKAKYSIQCKYTYALTADATEKCVKMNGNQTMGKFLIYACF